MGSKITPEIQQRVNKLFDKVFSKEFVDMHATYLQQRGLSLAIANEETLLAELVEDEKRMAKYQGILDTSTRIPDNERGMLEGMLEAYRAAHDVMIENYEEKSGKKFDSRLKRSIQ